MMFILFNYIYKNTQGVKEMSDTYGVLRLRVLLSFLKDDDTCTVTGISRTLNETKQSISRILIGLEKEGYIDRQDQRHPKLTEKGYEIAQIYSERINISQNHLIYEGVSIENAKKDAYYWAMFNSDNTMDIIRSSEKKYRVKYALRGKQRFTGTTLCKLLDDGDYTQPFIFYREHIQNGNNISMANEGFEHPCTLCVKDGVGMIQLQAKPIMQKSMSSGEQMIGEIKSLQYCDSGMYVGAEKSGNILSFPASALNFINIGEGISQILHGTVCCKMQCSVGSTHMPESTAIFTILF